MPEKPGPHLSMALFCERALQEKDDVLSVIRVIDRITINPGPGAPKTLPPGAVVQPTLIICLKSGNARGKHTLTIQTETPSFTRLPRIEVPVLFEGEDRGVNVIFQFALQIQEEGVYWIDVALNDTQPLTRVPLRIIYQPM